MIDLLDVVFAIFDVLLSWRLLAGLAATATACLALVGVLPNDTLRWIVCTPIALAGIFFSFLWQYRADRRA